MEIAFEEQEEVRGQGGGRKEGAPGGGGRGGGGGGGGEVSLTSPSSSSPRFGSDWRPGSLPHSPPQPCNQRQQAPRSGRCHVCSCARSRSS
eukprot:764334-Hanusia_phi.AAC.1